MIKQLRALALVLACTALATLPAVADSAAPTTLPALLPVNYPAPDVLSPAGRERLHAERAVFAQELTDDARWDPEKIKAAIARMNEGALDTVQDNVRRFGDALAALHDKFALAWEAHQGARPADAVGAMKPLLEEKVKLIKAHYQHNTMPPYSYTLTRMLFAEDVGRGGDVVEATISYQVCFEKLPDNFTFGLTARMRAARIYETTGRVHWAIPIYKSILSKYGSMLSDAENVRLSLKIAELVEKDPYRRAEQLAREMRTRLERGETGADLRNAQGHFLSQVAEMMVMPDEEPRPFLEHTDSVAKGAESGALQKGGVPQFILPGGDGSKAGNDDWGQLKPREKQHLTQMLQQSYPQRYRDMLQAYYKNMAEAEAKEDASGGGR